MNTNHNTRLYNEFVPAIAREIAHLAQPPSFVFMVNSVFHHSHLPLSIHTTFQEAVNRLLVQNYSDQGCQLHMWYVPKKEEFNLRCHGDYRPLWSNASCVCHKGACITVEHFGTDLSYEDPEPLFRWRLHAGRFYNGFLPGVHRDHMVGTKPVCFLMHLMDEQEVRSTRTTLPEEDKLKWWNAFRQNPPQIQRDTENILTEDAKYILEQVIPQVEAVNEGKMMQAYRRAVHKFVTCSVIRNNDGYYTYESIH